MAVTEVCERRDMDLVDSVVDNGDSAFGGPWHRGSQILESGSRVSKIGKEAATVHSKE